MKRTANILFLIVGIVMPIAIGALHTFVHFKDLVAPHVQEALSEPILLMGVEQAPWNTWGLMSFMMGASFIIIGLLNISALRKSKGAYPPVMNIIVMMLYLSFVLYAGHTFNAMPQFYGGIAGMLLSIVCLLLVMRGEKKLN